MPDFGDVLRRRLLVGGIVQGVGFRPYVFNLAESEKLVGTVTNTSAGVVIEIQGPATAIDNFCTRLRPDAPALSKIVSVESEVIPTITNDTSFTIEISQNTPGTNTIIPADMATCADCLDDIRDPHNRRFAYPFTNCTNCGPRWTIIDRIPYDRAYTSMVSFEMCEACQQEYEDPRDRRFHAQPNACPACGPQMWLVNADTGINTDTPLEDAARLLAEGKILAVKGLGGFHLAVNAFDQDAVMRLRKRKHREAKPLAVMTATLASASRLVHITEEDGELLQSPEAPIVLLEKHPSEDGVNIAVGIASDHRRLGIILPYTPLHHLLFDCLESQGINALVMTSGNSSDEPICLANEDAQTRLHNIADAFLLHNRDIKRRADDSVMQRVSKQAHFFRRSRGYAPIPIFVESKGPDIIAVGPELKNTICILKKDRAFISPHIGDLENLHAFEFFQETIDTLQSVLECDPEIIAYDSHPAYLSTQWALKQKSKGKQLVSVQHHHAHMVAVMAEYYLHNPVIGLIMDGTGYGNDKTIWGGEVLVGDAEKFSRLGHFETVPLPGGDAAVKAPWRTAISYLNQAVGSEELLELLPDTFEVHAVESVLEMLNKGINSPLTSSCGRLFDAVAALAGPWHQTQYEAQGAIELMALTSLEEVQISKPLFDVKLDQSLLLPASSLVLEVAKMARLKISPAVISARFHRTLIEILTQAALMASIKTGISNIVLAGGVFQNEILLSGLFNSLLAVGLNPYRPVQTPVNDGSIALGQAIIARAQLKN